MSVIISSACPPARRPRTRLQRRIDAGVDPRRAVSVILVPANDLAQGGSVFRVGVATSTGDIALGQVENCAFGGRCPCAKQRGVLRSGNLRPASGASSEVEIVAIEVTGLKTVGDLHARPSQASIASTARPW